MKDVMTVRNGEQLDCEADPYSAQPVYWAHADNRVLVATSITALHRHGLCPGVDFEAAVCHLLGQTGDSLAAGIQRVPPGSRLSIGQGGQITITPEPKPDPLDTAGLRRAEVGSRLMDGLGDAVDHFTSGVTPAIAIAGGIDSAALLALAEQTRPRTWTAISGIRDATLKRATTLANAFGAAQNTVEVPNGELPVEFAAAVEASESLIIDVAAVRRFVLYKTMAQNGETHVLSGLGADALLLGDPSLLNGGWRTRFATDRALMTKLLAPSAIHLVSSPAPVTAAPVTDEVAKEERRQLLTELLASRRMPTDSHAPRSLGVEAQLPYLSRAVVALGLGLTPTDLIDGPRGKTLLRDIWDGILDEELRQRVSPPRMPQSPLGTEDHRRWSILYDGTLSRDRLQQLPMLDGAKVRRLIGVFGREQRREHPGFAVIDRVLKRIASLSILQSRWSQAPHDA